MPVRNLPTQRDYERLIDRYIEARGAERDEIEAEIHKSFSIDVTLLVLDLSGFSRLTAEYGVIHYLAMVRRMHLLTNTLIDDHSGKVIKFEADNLFAYFDSVDQAIHFAMEMQSGFKGMNVMTDDSSDIYASIGIATGPVLLIDQKDAWGAPMNLASKLGEDLAGKGEILVHEDAFAASKSPGSYETESKELSVSGITIKARLLKGLALPGG